MKMRSIAIALGAATLLSACASYPDGAPGRYADIDYDGWYDGFYGPFNGGFWGPQGQFYYDEGGGRFHPDQANHFRHQDGGGFQHIQGHAPPRPDGGRMAGR